MGDWFEDAMEEVRESSATRRAARAQEVQDRAAREAEALRQIRLMSGATAAAMESFGVSAASAAAASAAVSAKIADAFRPPLGSEQQAEEALRQIVSYVRTSDDPFKTGGDWMARVTNAIAEAIRESEVSGNEED